MIRTDEGAPSRVVTVGGGVIAVAGIAIALTLHSREFTTTLWVLTACATVAIAFVAVNGLPIRGLRLRRSAFAAEAAFLDLCIAAPLFAYGGTSGATAAALALGAGFGIAAAVRRTTAPTDLARHGVIRVLIALGLLAYIERFVGFESLASGIGSALFAATLGLGVIVFAICVSAPLAALTHHLSVGKILARVASDPRSWIVAIANVAWGTVVHAALVQGHVAIAFTMWIPVMAIAILLRTIDDQHAELHRLRLVRDAVQAMLGDRDPLPQINAILATLRVPAFDETVTVLAATTQRLESWRTVTKLGPDLSPAGDELSRRVLVRMKFSGNEATTLRDDFYIAYAFGARASDGDLHGAMIVHRRADKPLSSEQVTQFVAAAAELAPVLRDMRSIAAAQSAATVDGLTGLFNRSTSVDRLQAMLEDTRIPGRGAVLLLDIDHFKSINDELGHAAGDDCLRSIGAIIRGAVRSGDVAGRIGGEEFLIVMPGATSDIALTVGERLRLAVQLGNMKYANGNAVTASIGVAAAATGDTVETLLARADRALYEAKRQGRNRIIEDTAETA
jgi:diguanylate cyclase (GGDEF)-like protein